MDQLAFSFLYLKQEPRSPAPPRPLTPWEKLAAGLAASEYQPKDILNRLAQMPENRKERAACEQACCRMSV